MINELCETCANSENCLWPITRLDKECLFINYRKRIEKIVLIINGKGGVGKDTVSDVILSFYKGIKISSVAGIKELAKQVGWDGTKDDKSRKFLSDLKILCEEYNDFTTNYMYNEYKKFKDNRNLEVFIAFIREGDKITKFKNLITDCRCKTVLVTRKEIDDKVFGNIADDEVTSYNYDIIFNNDIPLGEELNKTILEIFNELERKTIRGADAQVNVYDDLAIIP